MEILAAAFASTNEEGLALVVTVALILEIAPLAIDLVCKISDSNPPPAAAGKRQVIQWS